jgi:acetyl esterase/lipase
MELGLRRLADDELSAYIEESRRFNDSLRAAGDGSAPDITTPEGLRAARGKRAASSSPSARPPVERLAEVGSRRAPVRITVPAEGEVRAVCLNIHGGGFYLGPSAGSDARNARLADALAAAVVSVDYRLAPEHPWPAAPEDCETAALWLLEHAGRLFGTEALAIVGSSAGANLAMATLLRLRDRGLVGSIAGVALRFGAYDLSGRSPGGRLYAEEPFVRAYAGHVADRTDPDISPLYGDLRGLPPALLVVGTLDFLLEDNMAMAARLSAAGSDVDLRVYPESLHGFTSFPTAMATAATRGIESWLAKRLAGG